MAALLVAQLLIDAASPYESFDRSRLDETPMSDDAFWHSYFGADSDPDVEKRGEKYVDYFYYLFLNPSTPKLSKAPDPMVRACNAVWSALSGRCSYEESAKVLVQFEDPHLYWQAMDALLDKNDAARDAVEYRFGDPFGQFVADMCLHLKPSSHNCITLYFKLSQKVDGHYAEDIWGWDLERIIRDSPDAFLAHFDEFGGREERVRSFAYNSTISPRKRAALIDEYEKRAKNPNAQQVVLWIKDEEPKAAEIEKADRAGGRDYGIESTPLNYESRFAIFDLAQIDKMPPTDDTFWAVYAKQSTYDDASINKRVLLYKNYLSYLFLNPKQPKLSKKNDPMIRVLNAIYLALSDKQSYDSAAKNILATKHPLMYWIAIDRILNTDPDVSEGVLARYGNNPFMRFLENVCAKTQPGATNCLDLYFNLCNDADGYYAEILRWYDLGVLISNNPDTVLAHFERFHNVEHEIRIASNDMTPQKRTKLLETYRKHLPNPKAKMIMHWIEEGYDGFPDVPKGGN